MAIGWMTLLKSVPWSDVVGNAPRIAEGARKLWQAVGKRGADDSGAAGADPSPAPTLAALEARVADQEAELAELRRQLAASSELIAALAEQNTQLVARVDMLRRRLTGVAWLLAGLIVATGLGFLLGGR